MFSRPSGMDEVTAGQQIGPKQAILRAPRPVLALTPVKATRIIEFLMESRHSRDSMQTWKWLGSTFPCSGLRAVISRMSLVPAGQQ